MGETTFGKRLKLLMFVLDMTNGEFSKSIGISGSNLTNIITVKGRKPTHKTISRIVEEHKVNYDWIMTGRGPIFDGVNATHDKKYSFLLEENKKLRQMNAQMRQMNERLHDMVYGMERPELEQAAQAALAAQAAQAALAS